MARSPALGRAAALCLLLGCSSSAENAPPNVVPADDGGFNVEGGVVDPQSQNDQPIETCDQAAASKAYIGCEFWPTVVANSVWSIFDYAVIVANAGSAPADVEITGNGVSKRATVAPGTLTKLYLPWNAALKGPDSDACGRAVPMPGSVLARAGAYKLVSTRPVTVYQFNALEYAGKGGDKGKDWSSCPGTATACDASGLPIGCLSFSNDASLLLPQAALTGHYRVTGIHGWSHDDKKVTGAYVAITATRDGTHVTVDARGEILAGGDIPATHVGDKLTLTMNAGDVAELVGPPEATADLSGSLVTADQPIQLVAGAPCIEVPLGADACDHVEESVFPAETLGKDYVVTVPTSVSHRVVGHVVRLYGNRDGTHLTYAPQKPDGAPDALDAGQVADLGIVKSDFRVTGDQEFAVGTFMLAGTVADPVTHGKGDPSMSLATATAQYRKRYVFLAPNDYDTSYADVVAPIGAKVTIDGSSVTEGKPLGATGFAISRTYLSHTGAHHLEADQPVGLQLVGYGAYTSFQYPGGLELRAIAPPPIK